MVQKLSISRWQVDLICAACPYMRGMSLMDFGRRWSNPDQVVNSR